MGKNKANVKNRLNKELKNVDATEFGSNAGSNNVEKTEVSYNDGT